MMVESAAWIFPLLVLLVLIGGDASHARAAASVSGAAGVPQELLTRPWQARATVSIGAGIYEELLFRMIGIAALHLILVDLAKLSDRAGTAISVVLTAAAFAAYHDPVRADGTIEWLPAIQLGLAGGYFGLIYLSRGFGIVVALHALYDVVVLVVFPHTQATP
jgi:membrane protease YdiL (CAAX protease family)